MTPARHAFNDGSLAARERQNNPEPCVRSTQIPPFWGKLEAKFKESNNAASRFWPVKPCIQPSVSISAGRSATVSMT